MERITVGADDVERTELFRCAFLPDPCYRLEMLTGALSCALREMPVRVPGTER